MTYSLVGIDREKKFAEKDSLKEMKIAKRH